MRERRLYLQFNYWLRDVNPDFPGDGGPKIKIIPIDIAEANLDEVIVQAKKLWQEIVRDVRKGRCGYYFDSADLRPCAKLIYEESLS